MPNEMTELFLAQLKPLLLLFSHNSNHWFTLKMSNEESILYFQTYAAIVPKQGGGYLSTTTIFGVPVGSEILLSYKCRL